MKQEKSGAIKEKQDTRFVRVTVNLPVDIANELARRANLERRSLASFAGMALEKAAAKLETA